MRPLRPFCGTVSNAQLFVLPAICRIIAPGVVTTQLSSVPPASSNATDVEGSSDSRLATAQPPEPPPTTTKSKLSMSRPPVSFCRGGWAFMEILARVRFQLKADFRRCVVSRQEKQVATYLGGCRPDEFTQSSRCAAVSAWRAFLSICSFSGPGGSSEAFFRASFANDASRSFKESICRRCRLSTACPSFSMGREHWRPGSDIRILSLRVRLRMSEPKGHQQIYGSSEALTSDVPLKRSQRN